MSHWCEKTPDKSNLEAGGAFWLTVQRTTVYYGWGRHDGSQFKGLQSTVAGEDMMTSSSKGYNLPLTGEGMIAGVRGSWSNYIHCQEAEENVAT